MNKSALLLCPLFLIPLLALAQPIQNPYYEETSWKVWLDDPSPVNGLELPPENRRLYPEDPSATESDSGTFLKYRTQDWPGRVYAGFTHDLFISLDQLHTGVEYEFLGDEGNQVSLRDAAAGEGKWGGYRLMHENGGQIRPNGALWTNQSTTLMGHDRVETASDIEVLERDFYFANALRAGPAFTSIGGTRDDYPALVPSFFNTIGASFSVPQAYSRMIVAGSYLPTETKRRAQREGLFMPTMLYAWKAGLPYQSDFANPLRHRIAYIGQGIPGMPTGTARDSAYTPDATFERLGDLTFSYNPSEHARGMVERLKDMRSVPPIAIFGDIEVLQGSLPEPNQNFFGRTTARIDQANGQTVQLRVSTADAYDLQGYPLTFRFRVLYGNKDTRIEQDLAHDPSGQTYRITVPWDDTLPVGRTTILMIANNGVHDSNPAAINVYRPNATADLPDPMIPPVGLETTTITPSETVNFDLFSRGSLPTPVEYTLWNSAQGSMDGNRYEWTAPADANGAVDEIVVLNDEGTNGNAGNGAKARVHVSETVAEAAPSVQTGFAPLTVSFDGSASRDRDGNTLTYLWDFGDGSTATTANPNHTFTTPGIRRVQLTVTGPLGSHTDTCWIEVLPDASMPLVLKNGWDGSGINASIWSNDGAAVDSDGALEVAPPRNETASITSTQTFSGALWLETDFKLKENGPVDVTGIFFDILGHRFGVVPRYEGDVLNRNPLGFWGQPEQGSGNGERFDFLLPVQSNKEIHTLRVFVEDDPANSGRIRMSGYVANLSGEHWFQFDNLERLKNTVGIESTGIRPSLTVSRWEIWSPEGTPVNAPSIQVVDSLGRELLDRERINQGHQPLSEAHFGFPAMVGGTVSRTFTIRNRGNSPLLLSEQPPIPGAGVFQIAAQPDTSIPAQGQSAFTVEFTPGDDRFFTTQLTVNSNDPNRSAPAVPVAGFGPSAPEIQIQGQRLNIADGETVPSHGNGTDFGSTPLEQSITQTFVIHNLGTENLGGISANLSGADANQFSISRQARDTLGAFGSTFVNVTFQPDAAGVFSATVTITSDDSDEPTTSFAIQATAESAPIDAAASVNFDGVSVADGSATPTASNGTDFGPVALGATKQHSFAIENTGGPLHLGRPIISGPDADAFAVVELPLPKLLENGQTRWAVVFFPNTTGPHEANIAIPTNDPTAEDYTFTLAGQGVDAGFAEIRGNGFDIVTGDNTPATFDGTEFPSTSLGANQSHTFTITNGSDSDSLTISNVFTGGTNAADFTITSFPDSLAAGASGDIVLTFTPTAGGSRTATVQVESDDPNAPFTFAVAGQGSGFEVTSLAGIPSGNGSHRWADFDNDGDLDLLWSGDVDGEYLTRIYRNDNGSFSVPVGMTDLPGSFDQANHWADVDADGDLDFSLLANESGFAHDLYHNDSGSFTAQLSALDYERFAAPVWSDFDGDGDLDLSVIARESGEDNQLLIYENDGSGNLQVFTPSLSFGVVPFAFLENVDVDLDGDLDYVFGASPAPLVLFNDNGAFTRTEALPIPSGDLADGRVEDIDGDGDPDILLVDFELSFTQGSFNVSSTLYVIGNDPDGFALRQSFLLGDASTLSSAFTTGDIDNDGDKDIITLFSDIDGNSHVQIHENQSGAFVATGGLTALPGYNLANSLEIHATDFDLDGDVDITMNAESDQNLLLIRNAISPNSPPNAPTNLQAALNGETVALTWNAPSDDTTPTDALTYNLRVGIAPEQGDIAPAMANLTTGLRKISNDGTIRVPFHELTLPPGTYYAAVQAIDASRAGGAWSNELSITIGDEVTYAQWRDSISWPAGADTSFGGRLPAAPFANGIYFALGLGTPGTPVSDVPHIYTANAEDGSWFVMEYPLNLEAEGVSLVIRSSTDLSQWNDVIPNGVDVIQSVVDPDLDGDGKRALMSMRIRLQPDDDAMFFRILVSETP